MPKKGEPEEDIEEEQAEAESAGAQPSNTTGFELYDLTTLEKLAVDKGKPIWVDEETEKVLAFKVKDPSGIVGVVHAMDDNKFYFEPDDGSAPYLIGDKTTPSLIKLVEKYQLAADNVYAGRKTAEAAKAAEEAAKKAAEPKPVPLTEAPKEEDIVFEEIEGEQETLETKVAPAAPTPAKGMEYKFVDGIWSAYVAVYDGGKKIGEYSAFGGIVKGPNVDKLDKPVLERIKEKYFEGMKGK